MNAPSRIQGMTPSPIRRMGQGAPEGTISLGLGEPGWPLPRPAREALALAGQTDGPLPYGPNSALPELVEAIANLTRPTAQAGVPDTPGEPSRQSASALVTADEVMVTAGSQAALFALFQAHVEADTTVLVPDPGFVSYPTLARLCGARPVSYPLAPDGSLDAEALVATLRQQPTTSLVVINHPANPTGGTASPEALVSVAQACALTGALLVSDEVYRELWVGTRPAGLHDVGGLAAGVVLGSLSKAFGAPGLRIGWALGEPDVLAPARLVHNAMNTAPSRISQLAGVALLHSAEEVLAQARGHVLDRWETLARVAPELVKHAGLDLGPAHTPGRNDPHDRSVTRAAGFYLWLPLPADVAQEKTEEFALQVRDRSRVTTIPGTAFGRAGAGHLRVSLGGPVDELEEGLARLAPWWKA